VSSPTHIGDSTTAAILAGTRADILDDLGDARRSLHRAIERATRAGAPPEVIDAIRAALHAVEDVRLPGGYVMPDGYRWG